MAGKERIAVIDIMKGVMIIIIAVFHIVYRPMDSVVDIALQGSTYLFIPLFFILSGYFYRYDKSVIPSVGTRLKKFALPIVGSSLAILVILCPYYMLVHGYTPHQWISDLLTTYLRPELMSWILPSYSDVGPLFENVSPVWYIWALVMATVVFYFVMNLVHNDSIKILVMAGVLFVIGSITYVTLPPMSWSLTNTPVYAGLMMIGFLLNKHKVLQKLYEFNLAVSFVIATAAFVIHFFIYKYLGFAQMYRSVYDHDHTFYATAVFIVQAFIGGYAMLTYARVVEKIKPLSVALQWVGRHTPEIIVTHYVFGGLASDLLRNYNKCGVNWYLDDLTPEIIIKSAIACVIALAGSFLVGYLNDIFWGKYKERKQAG
ncbi:Fucose 4-O-acetylase [Ruminococcaceae bacterium YRB3002]|nr:Fucose 4-O-acetylase [Ruminococcaceae bacterium YRB3002]